MQVRNVHERVYVSDPGSVGALIDSLANAKDDRLWPYEMWPPMRLDQPLSVGARGGHGPIRYFVEQYVPNRKVVFRFLAPRGFEGTHGFEVEDGQRQIVLRHLLYMRTSGAALLSWPLVFRPLHDALIEDSLYKAGVSMGITANQPPKWSTYVRILRVFFKARRLRS